MIHFHIFTWFIRKFIASKRRAFYLLQAHVRDTRAAALSNGCMVEGLVLSFSLGTNVWPKVLKRMNGYEGSKRQRDRESVKKLHRIQFSSLCMILSNANRGRWSWSGKSFVGRSFGWFFVCAKKEVYLLRMPSIVSLLSGAEHGTNFSDLHTQTMPFETGCIKHGKHSARAASIPPPEARVMLICSILIVCKFIGSLLQAVVLLSSIVATSFFHFLPFSVRFCCILLLFGWWVR